MEIIIRDLTKSYKQGNDVVEAVRGVTLSINQGDFIVLLGPSGGGKSTFLNLVGGIDRPSTGSIKYGTFAMETASEDQLTCFRRDHIGFVFQFYNLLSSLTALENVMLPMMARGENHVETQNKAVSILNSMGLGSRLNHVPGKLSGGEQQRVAIARAIICEPELIIADEPTGDLDSITSHEIINLLHDLNRKMKITLLVATHNLSLCEKADRVLEIRDGFIHA